MVKVIVFNGFEKILEFRSFCVSLRNKDDLKSVIWYEKYLKKATKKLHIIKRILRLSHHIGGFSIIRPNQQI